MAIKNALMNLAMPMRVEGARLLQFLQAAIDPAADPHRRETNNVRVNSSFSTDHRVMRLLPAATPTLSRRL